MNMDLAVIGYIENIVDKQSDEDWSSIKSRIRLNNDPEFLIS